jgi:hypothetical protein
MSGEGSRPGFGEGLTPEQISQHLKEAGQTNSGAPKGRDPREGDMLNQEDTRLADIANALKPKID